ncbi:MAG TPA: GDSL-type esterase/lipase family protein [Acidobacteriaceae bacterium]|jgi:alpha-galactosidase
MSVLSLSSLRKLSVAALLGVSCCAQTFAQSVVQSVARPGLLRKGTTVKIMPVGDSITEGKFVTGGYRKPLDDLLKAGGYSVTFVGKEDNGEPANETGFSTGMENPKHEGYGSARIGMLLNGGTTEQHTALPIKTSMLNNAPDVVLVMLGTNDILGITPTETMQHTMEKLVSSIFEQNPDAAVVLASVPPIRKSEARDADVAAYNAVLPGIVEREKARNHKIEFADMHGVFTLPTDLSGDLVHPTVQGYAKMARLWYSVLTGEQAPAQPPPPMGWNSWNFFFQKVDDKAVRAAADALVSTGLRDAGYIYVNIDDSWEGTRDAAGNIRSNEKFPDMKALADYVHSKGLKLGIYSSPGAQTCAHFEGSLGHEEQDAKTYAAWGIDFLKYDLCSYGKVMQQAAPNDIGAQYRMMRAAYQTMNVALRKAGRPIVYSLCQYGLDDVWTWGPSVGANLWRTTGDIHATYERMADIGFQQAGLSRFAGAGHWNDPDMLEVGNGKMSLEENRTHFTLWAMLAAPLIAGNDLGHMDAQTLAILGNRDVIAIDQDPAYVQGDRAFAEGPLEVWTKPLANGGKAIAIFNRGDVPLHGVALDSILHKLGYKTPPQLRDLWGAKDVTVNGEGGRFDLKKHEVLLLRAGS